MRHNVHRHRNFRRARHNDRPNRQQVRADGREYQSIDGRHQNGPIRGQSVRGRARGGRHDDAVRSKARHKLAVELNGKFADARNRSLGQNDVVQRIPAAKHAALPLQFRMHQAARIQHRRTRQPGFQRAVDFRQRNLGQESQRPEIYAQQRHIGIGKGARRRKQRSIPTQGDGDVGPALGHLRAFHRFVFAAEVARTLGIQQKRKPVAGEPCKQVGQDPFQLRLVGLGNNGG